MKNLHKLLLTFIFAITVSGVVYAATQSFTANTRFIRPITFAAVSDPDLGDWLAGASARAIGIDSAGTATGVTADYVAGATAGSIDILGSPSRTISIVANNFQNNGGSVDITAIPCNFDATGAATCSGAGLTGITTAVLGKTLSLGVTAVTNAISTDGETAAPTFDLVVSYE